MSSACHMSGPVRDTWTLVSLKFRRFTREKLSALRAAFRLGVQQTSKVALQMLSASGFAKMRLPGLGRERNLKRRVRNLATFPTAQPPGVAWK